MDATKRSTQTVIVSGKGNKKNEISSEYFTYNGGGGRSHYSFMYAGNNIYDFSC